MHPGLLAVLLASGLAVAEDAPPPPPPDAIDACNAIADPAGRETCWRAMDCTVLSPPGRQKRCELLQADCAAIQDAKARKRCEDDKRAAAQPPPKPPERADANRMEAESTDE